jgi:hypothetical protein
MFFENWQYCLQYYYYCLQYCLKFINIVSSKQYYIPYCFKNIIFYIINNIVTYVYNIVWALSIFFLQRNNIVFVLFVLFAVLYVLFTILFVKNYVVTMLFVLFTILLVSVFWYNMVLFFSYIIGICYHVSYCFSLVLLCYILVTLSP